MTSENGTLEVSEAADLNDLYGYGFHLVWFVKPNEQKPQFDS